MDGDTIKDVSYVYYYIPVNFTNKQKILKK